MNSKIIAFFAASISASRIGQTNDDVVACHELPGAHITCGSHCWPDCDSTNDGTHPDAQDFNHYLVIPEARSCYIDTIDYGRFDAYMSQNSLLTVT
jgi:hypothetical protein